MNKEMKKVPTVRFKGFTDDWEQRKLKELVDKYEKSVETPHDGYIRLGVRSHGKGTFHEYVEPGHELETAKMYQVAANKLIFNITFAWEHAVALTDSDDEGKLVSHRFPQFSLHDNLIPDFLKYVILDEKFHHHLYLSSPGGAGRNRVLKINEALDYSIKIPSVLEQKKIGQTLNNITNLITLHQRKLDQLQTLKKYFLQNMFPAKGEKVPAIRFKGFTGDWKEQKFGDLCSVIDTKHATAPITDKQTIFRMIRTDCVRNGQLIVEKTDSVKEEIYEKWSERIYLQPGDLVFTREAPMGECAIIPDDGNKYFPGQRIVTLRAKGKTATIFINYLVYADEFRKEIRMRDSASTTVANFGISAIKEYTTLFPQPEEQLAIGKYFAYLDNLITLHQRKCDQLQSLKKFMLQNLFI